MWQISYPSAIGTRLGNYLCVKNLTMNKPCYDINKELYLEPLVPLISRIMTIV